MNESENNKYAVISYELPYKIVILKWFPATKHMSDFEFHESVHELFDMAKSLKTWIIYIDALDLNYPINEETIVLVKNSLKECPVRDFRLVESKDIIVKKSLSSLISKTKNPRFKLRIFQTRAIGESWLNAFRTLLA